MTLALRLLSVPVRLLKIQTVKRSLTVIETQNEIARQTERAKKFLTMKARPKRMSMLFENP